MEKFEKKDFNVRNVAWTEAGLLIFLILAGGLLFIRQKYLVDGFHPNEAAPLSTPRNQVEFESGLIQQKLYAQQNKLLDSYRWNDPSQASAQVPLKRAIQQIVNAKSTDPRLLFPHLKAGVK